MKMLLTLFLAFLLAPAALWPLPAAAQPAELAEPEVPFVPTPEEVVAEMLRLAEVGADDYLYDLGCGDGRIVITAAREHGARGTGVDIDPDRIRESRQNAAEAQVDGQVDFMQADLFDVDLQQATVVTLYLLPDVNLRLRPKLLRELEPGTRIVSHDFHMEEWAPREMTRMPGHTVYYWVVPANATGTWQGSRRGTQGEEPFRLEIAQNFQYVNGFLEMNGRRLPISEGEVDGDRVRLLLADGLDGSATPAVFEGRLQGDELRGELRQGNAGAVVWQAVRDPGTMQPLDGDELLRASGE